MARVGEHRLSLLWIRVFFIVFVALATVTFGQGMGPGMMEGGSNMNMSQMMNGGSNMNMSQMMNGSNTSKPQSNHGGVKMGVADPNCDDGVHGIEVDWDGKDPEPYTCNREYNIAPGTGDPYEEDEAQTKDPIHVCLPHKITYDKTPLSGKHRPLWPAYGEYKYLPPQRWVHSLEHGAVVFLYHPCTPPGEVDRFRKVVTGCMWKHVISPSKMLHVEMPYALISWGHGSFLDHFNVDQVIAWIKAHGMKDGLENDVFEDGQYTVGLETPATVIGNGTDSDVCTDYQTKNRLSILAHEFIDS